MKRHLLQTTTLMFAVAALLLSGCAASKQARSVEPQGFLVNPQILTKGDGDQALLRYQKPGVNLKKYSKVMIMQVKFSRPKDVTPEGLGELQKLASNFNQYLFTELSKDYRITNFPDADTMIIETALVEAEKSMPGMDTISTVVPIGLGISIIKDFATGKPSFVGELTGEMKLSDGVSGELLGAAVDRRVGGKNWGNMFNTWGDANSAMEYWAKKLRYGLCKNRGGSNCEDPGN